MIADRITKNWRTTTLALAVLVVIGGIVYTETISLQEALGWLTTAITFLFSDDSLIKKNKQDVSKENK